MATLPSRSISLSTSAGSLLAPNPESTGFCCSEIILPLFFRHYTVDRPILSLKRENLISFCII